MSARRHAPSPGHAPSDDTLVITSTDPSSAHDPDAQQIFRPQHCGSFTAEPGMERGTLHLASAHCSGCGERQTEIALMGPDGRAIYVKLRPAMALKLGELLFIHGKAGIVAQ